jgi:hypothetical protein
MNKELTEKLLSMYVEGDQGLNESTKHPFPMKWNNKKWCAGTNRYHFIMIPENSENTLEEPHVKTPNIAGVIPKFDITKTVTIDNLKIAYEGIESITREVSHKCQCCSGKGQFEYLGHYYECKNCNRVYWDWQK